LSISQPSPPPLPYIFFLPLDVYIPFTHFYLWQTIEKRAGYNSVRRGCDRAKRERKM
jgi:hypothetical protein